MNTPSRPDYKFQEWNNYSVYEIEPLTLEKACELVNKLPFDDEVKHIFVDKLRDDLFVQHHSFLSNPLLLSIMLITYRENAEIPNKISLFYEQAYHALFSQHDAYKGGYKRESNSGLDISDMRHVFSAFCLLTFDQRIFQFVEADAIEYLNKASRITGIELNSSKVLADLRQGVCLLIDDGLQLTFSHRSFQEYFTARFISETEVEVKCKFLRKHIDNVGADNVVVLLFEIDREFVENEYLLPELEYLAKHLKVKKRVGIMAYTRYLKLILGDFDIVSLDTHFGVAWESATGEVERRVRVLVRFAAHVLRESIIVGVPNDENQEWKKVKELEGFTENQSISLHGIGLSHRSEIVRYMSVYGGWFALRRLQNMLDIRWEIKRKQKLKSDVMSELL